jgi:hypothetical protein
MAAAGEADRIQRLISDHGSLPARGAQPSAAR